MNVISFTKKRPIVFALAILAAMSMVLISEGAYWRSIRTLTEIATTGTARTQIQEIRLDVLEAQMAQRRYVRTGRSEYMASYRNAIAGIEASYEILQLRYGPLQTHAVTLKRMHSVTDALLLQLATNIRQHDGGQRVLEEINDNGQYEALRARSAELLHFEEARAAISQGDLYQTLMLGRLGVALLSVISLLALVMYLRQSFALERHRQRAQLRMQTQRDGLELEVSQRTAQLTELTHYLQTAREDERNRLARNLHDDLGALLTSAKLDAARIRSRLLAANIAPQAMGLLAHLVATLNSGITLGRRIIEDLRPSGLGTLGLVGTLEILVKEYASTAGLKTHTALTPVPLDENAELMVYRLVQEALTNIGKHANAREVWVTMGLNGDRVGVSVRDDGAGFDAKATTNSAFGLVGMRFRVEAEGGTLTVVSAKGQGTLIQVQIPQAGATVI